MLRKVAEIFQESVPENCEVIRIGGAEACYLADQAMYRDKKETHR